MGKAHTIGYEEELWIFWNQQFNIPSAKIAREITKNKTRREKREKRIMRKESKVVERRR